jgi:hypothetical protein
VCALASAEPGEASHQVGRCERERRLAELGEDAPAVSWWRGDSLEGQLEVGRAPRLGLFEERGVEEVHREGEWVLSGR